MNLSDAHYKVLQWLSEGKPIHELTESGTHEEYSNAYRDCFRLQLCNGRGGLSRDGKGELRDLQGRFELTKLKELIVEAIAEASSAQCKSDKGAAPKVDSLKGRPTANQRMLEMLQDDPSLVNLSARQWGEKLGVSGSAVQQTRTWKKTIRSARAITKADRVNSGK